MPGNFLNREFLCKGPGSLRAMDLFAEVALAQIKFHKAHGLNNKNLLLWRSRNGQMPAVLCVAASGHYRFLGIPWPWLQHSGFGLLHLFMPIFCLSPMSLCLSLRQILAFGKSGMTSSTSLYKSYTDLFFKQDSTSLELRHGCLFGAVLIPAIRVRTTLVDLCSSGHY